MNKKAAIVAEPNLNVVPFSREAEIGILGSMIATPEIIPQVRAELGDGSFYLDNHKLIYAAITKLYNEHHKVDLILLKDALGDSIGAIGGYEYLVGLLSDLPNDADWKSYIVVLNKRSRQREHLQQCEQIKEAILTDQPQDKVYEIANTIRATCPIELGNNASDMAMLALSGLAAAKTTGNEMTWGWVNLDRTVGGLRRKRVYVVGGKTSQGKTTVVSNVVIHNLRAGKKVLMCVLENPDETPIRLAAIDSGVRLDHFLKPDQLGDESYNKAVAALEGLKRFKDQLLVVGSTSMAALKALTDKYKPDILVLDYLQKYADRFCTGDTGTKAHEVGAAASDFGSIAIDCNCAGILLSQFKRLSPLEKNRKPELSDLKESGDIENYADVALLLYWRWRDTLKESDDPYKYEIVVAKNKLGPVMDVSLKINPETLTITEWGKEYGSL